MEFIYRYLPRDLSERLYLHPRETEGIFLLLFLLSFFSRTFLTSKN